MNTKDYIYQIMIERLDEEYELVEEFENLEEAIKFAKTYGREHYRCIWIEEVDKKGNYIKTIEVEQ